MLQSFVYFPTLIYRDEHPEWVDYINKITEKYFENSDSQEFVYQTCEMLNDSNLSFLYDYLLNSSIDILKNQGYLVDNYELYVNHLWGQEIKKDGLTDTHLHKNSQLCGWIFLETPKNGSFPIYYDPRLNKEMVELDPLITNEVLMSTSKIFFDNIIPGTVLISNSWIKHQLSRNNSSLSTKAIHFIISQREKLCNI